MITMGEMTDAYEKDRAVQKDQIGENGAPDDDGDRTSRGRGGTAVEHDAGKAAAISGTPFANATAFRQYTFSPSKTTLSQQQKN